MELLLLPHARYHCGRLIVALKEEVLAPAIMVLVEHKKPLKVTETFSFFSKYLLAFFCSAFTFIIAVKELAIEKLDGNDGKNELKRVDKYVVNR